MPSASWLPLTALPKLTQTPILVVNEPIYVTSNPTTAYDAFYDKTLYDRYRQVLIEFCANNGLWCLDLWNNLPQVDFSDSPFHHTPEGNKAIASLVADEFERKLGPK